MSDRPSNQMPPDGETPDARVPGEPPPHDQLQSDQLQDDQPVDERPLSDPQASSIPLHATPPPIPATETRPAPPPAPPSKSLGQRLTGRTGSRLFASALSAWIIVVSFVAQFTPWLLEAIAAQPDSSGPWWRASLIQGLLIGLPLSYFALRWRAVRYRAIFQTWAWATGYLLVMAPTRMLSSVDGQLIVLLQVLVTLIYWLVVRRWQKERVPVPPSGVALALLVGGVTALPWLRFGALGAPLDVLLNGALAALFGLLVWTLLQIAWIPAQRRDPRHPRRDRMTSGLIAGVMLVILASAISFNGVQLLLMVMLPGLGWALVAAGAPALATALVVAAPLLLVDSDGMVLLAMDWLMAAYFMAALLTMASGWLLAVVSLLFQPDPARKVSSPVAWSGAAVVLLAALVVYVTVGQMGFFGDRTFVVLRDQADVSAAMTLPDLPARRTTVYHTLVEYADSTQADLRATLDRFGIGYQPYYLTNGLEVRGGLFIRWWLRTRGDVAEVMVSPRLRPVESWQVDLAEPVDAPSEAQWNLTSIGATRVWQELGITGEGIVIGQSDSGVQGDHPEFGARYRGATMGNDYNWLDPWLATSAPYDESGHGTHTLGTVLGETVGIAPGATWFACANLVRNLGNPALYLDCMQFMLAPWPQAGDAMRDGDPTLAADVLNNSWGCPTDFEGCTPTVFAPAVNALSEAGIYVVTSAGNDGPACSTLSSPLAIYGEVLSVGAIDAAGNLAFFSSAGPVTVDGSGRVKPDLVAPGVDVLSAWPGSRYHTASGTSMAGPHLAGTVALMWAANPALRGDVARTTQILTETAQPFVGGVESRGLTADDATSNDVAAAARPLAAMMDIANSCLAHTDLNHIPNNVAGYGVVDVYAAVEAARALQ